MARAARIVGVNMILSSNSTTSMEDVMQAATFPQDKHSPSLWFQLYVLRDRGVTLELIRCAEAAGYDALCVTVDAPVMGNRLHERT